MRQIVASQHVATFERLAGSCVSAPSPAEAQHRLRLVLTPSIDYIIMEAMRFRQTQKARDQQVLSEVLDMLQEYEHLVQKLKTRRANEMLNARAKSDQAKDIGWVFLVFVFVLVAVWAMTILNLLANRQGN